MAVSRFSKRGYVDTGRRKESLQRQIGRSVAHEGGDAAYPSDGKREAAPSDRRLDLWRPTRQGAQSHVYNFNRVRVILGKLRTHVDLDSGQIALTDVHARVANSPLLREASFCYSK